jgi:hypothetical protein
MSAMAFRSARARAALVSLVALVAPVALSMSVAPAPLRAQAEGGFDLSTLALPPGFLDLTDVVITADASGRLVATAMTTIGDARTRVLLAYERGAAGGMMLALKPERWSLTEAIPALSNPVLDGMDFSNVALVATGSDRASMSAELIPEEWAFFREVYQADAFALTLRPGLNLVAALPAEELGPDHPLTTVMDALGIERGVLLIQGTLGQSLGLIGGGAPSADVVRDLYLRAELPPLRPPGSPEWFRSGQLALELTGDPSVRLVGEMTVLVEGEELVFFLAAAMARTGVSLSGGLLAEDGWEQPFGIPWLVMNGVVLKIGITAAGSIQLGFGGDMVIGEKDIAVAVAVALNAATGVPTNFIFEGESDAGFGLSDLVMLQSRMRAAREALGEGEATGPAIPLDALPPIDFREVGLQFAPRPEPDLGVERGMAIRGRLWLPTSADGEPTDFAGVDVAVSEDGLWARGDLGAFELGPLVWQDAKLDLTATRDDQHFLVSGEVELLGARQLVDLSLSRERFSFRTETRLYEMFSADVTATSVFNLRQPAFQIDAVASADFGDLVGPLVQIGVVRFAQTGADVLAAARTASDAAGVVLANSEASLAQLRQALDAQRTTAEGAMLAARADADRAAAALRASLATRNVRLRAFQATPRRQVRLRAQRLAAYTAAHRVYLTHAAVYAGANARRVARERVYAAIPPTDRRVTVLAADEAIRVLRQQLQEMQSNLAALEAQYTRITDAVAAGEQLLRIDQAEFHAGLAAAQRGEAVQWSIRGEFVGGPFEVEETLDFSNVGEGAAQFLRALMNR